MSTFFCLNLCYTYCINMGGNFMPMLGYKRKFKNIDSLKDDVFEKFDEEVFKRYDKSKYDIDDHFALYHKMVDIGSKVTRNYKNI